MTYISAIYNVMIPGGFAALNIASNLKTQIPVDVH